MGIKKIDLVKKYIGISELAKELSYDRSFISRVLHGHRRPSAQLRKKLESLNVRVPDYPAPRWTRSPKHECKSNKEV